MHVLLYACMNQNVLKLQTSWLGMQISTVLLKNEYLTQKSVGTSEYGAIPLVQKPIKCVHIFKAFSLILLNNSFCLSIQEYFSYKQMLETSHRSVFKLV
jgi:hypothetical protein